MSGFLEQMARSSAARVAEAKARLGEAELRVRARAAPAAPPLTLAAEGFDLIAESKLRSPAAGRLATGTAAGTEQIAARVQRYAQAGAAAVSVLTEPTRFDGSLEHLEAAARALSGGAREAAAERRLSGPPTAQAQPVPAMRKDFLVDPYQVLEARVAGAGGVLVILRMLSDGDVLALLECAREQGLFVLLEAFDETDIERARAIVERRSDAAQARSPMLLVGINCRDLDTLQVVPGRLEALAARLPAGVPRVAESGVGCSEDAARVAAAGYDLALVGSALMTDGDPAALVRDMLAAGRRAKRRVGSRAPADAPTGAALRGRP